MPSPPQSELCDGGEGAGGGRAGIDANGGRHAPGPAVMYATKSVPLNNAPRCLKCAVLYIRQVATDKGLTGIYQSKTPYAINGAILSVQDIMEMCADITQIDIDPSTPGTTTP